MAEKTRTITQREFIPGVTPGAVYDALLDGKKHSKLIGGKATGNATVGSAFTAWDGYITGTNLELEPGKRILQAWQTSEWPEGAEPSHVEWTFTGEDGGTEDGGTEDGGTEDGGTHVTLVHSNVPAEQAESYRQGWIDYYWTPMKAYFAK